MRMMGLKSIIAAAGLTLASAGAVAAAPANTTAAAPAAAAAATPGVTVDAPTGTTAAPATAPAAPKPADPTLAADGTQLNKPVAHIGQPTDGYFGIQPQVTENGQMGQCFTTLCWYR